MKLGELLVIFALMRIKYAVEIHAGEIGAEKNGAGDVVGKLALGRLALGGLALGGAEPAKKRRTQASLPVCLLPSTQ